MIIKLQDNEGNTVFLKQTQRFKIAMDHIRAAAPMGTWGNIRPNKPVITGATESEARAIRAQWGEAVTFAEAE